MGSLDVSSDQFLRETSLSPKGPAPWIERQLRDGGQEITPMLSQRVVEPGNVVGLAPLLWAEYDSAEILGRGSDGTINKDKIRPRELWDDVARAGHKGAVLRWKPDPCYLGVGNSRIFAWVLACDGSRQLRAVAEMRKYDGIAVAVDEIARMVVARSRVVVRKSLPELRKGWGDVWGKTVLLLRQERWVTTADDGNHERRELIAAPHFRPRPPPHPGKRRYIKDYVIISDTCRAPELRGVACLASCLAGSLLKLQPPAPCPVTKRQLKAANPQPSTHTIEPRC